MSDPNWMQAYVAAISRDDKSGAKKAPSVGCCPICCTFFSLFGAMFLFIVGGLMNSHYRYIHIAGDMGELSKSVTYAGIIYLAFAVLSVLVWVRKAMKVGAWVRSGASATSFTQLQN